MTGVLRKSMVWLGMAEEDDHYDGYDELDDERADPDDRARSGGHETEHRAQVTPLPQRQTPVARVVRDTEVSALTRITTIHPRTYNEAKKIGEAFRAGTPVIMNLSDMADDDAKRLVDFAAGLIFGLHGEIERVTSKVFLLSPAHVEVSSEVSPEVPRQARGFFNQS